MGNLSRSHDAIGSTGEGEEALADWIGRGMRWLHGHDVLAWQCVREFYKVKPWGKIALGRSARYDARRRGVAIVDGWILGQLEPTTVRIDTCPDNQYGA